MLLLATLLACDSATPAGGGLVFAELPPCEPLPEGDTLDLAAGCAAGVCADMDYTSFVSVLGEPEECESSFDDNLRCDWTAAGVHAYFDQLDGAVDPASDAGVLFVDEAFTGADEHGLGIGVSLNCFMDVFGQPPEVNAELVYDAYYVDELSFQEPHVSLYDGDALDGISARMSLFGT